ncbi:hypothetical protein HETIRDRAFT_461331 [Heterobasidion irregulare TC 32-1]|uniref:Protein kinase domain-containing protein n=1 Tax=Heterobasidion irregulare (strain TC 32-1) TaxID=747525 RepID=W4JPH4_HETIT|nr:uncharacterized protein HETIRDRAFT_461331 [Heterobasidion irregulare TC 32-1]ETW75472.1 hypothetical protein HETIRDRAFT_461331 [Heterobasidion irregulare TC 32-1]
MQPPRTGTAFRVRRPSSLFKESLGGSIARRLTRPIVKPLLKEELMDTLQVGLLIEDFVYRIWGFHPDRLQWEKFFKDLQLDYTLVEAYKATLQHAERYRYAPFARLIDSIVAKLVEVLKLESPLPVSFEPLGSTYIRSDRSNRKPDMGIIGKQAVEEYRLAQDGPDKHSKAQLRWEIVPCFMEFKRFLPIDHDAVILFSQAPGAISEPVAIALKPDDECRQEGLKRKNVSDEGLPPAKRVNQDPNITSDRSDRSGGSVDESHSTSSVPIEVPNAGASISAVGTGTEPENFETHRSRCKLSPQMTEDELQAANYASECLGDGRRRYVTSFMITDLKVSLWYYDRIGVIKSEEFDLVENPRLFVLAIAAVTTCDMKHFGFEPMIHPPSTIPPPMRLEHPIRLEPPRNISGWEIHIDEGVDSEGKMVPSVVRLRITGAPIYVQAGIVGRGTSVIPASAFADSGLAAVKSSQKLVVKFSWPAATRVPEDVLIRRIRKAIGSKEARHVSRMRMSTTLEGLRLGLPRIEESIQSLPGDVETRVLRVLVCDRYQHLNKLKTISEFQSVFIDLVRAHRVVYKRAGILHRDLSINNVMFGMRSGKPYGILIDWDLAIDMKLREDDGDGPSSRYRTGTGPFMAIDLLKPKMGPPHYYRHDLESFFYILLWSACTFLLNGTEVKKQHKLVEPWSVVNWGDIRDKKVGFFSRAGEGFGDLNEAVTEPFRLLLDSWIRPLGRMIATARSTSELAQLNDSPFDPETWGGLMTYRKFLGAVNVDFKNAPHSLDADLLD